MARKEQQFVVTGKVTISYHMSDQRETLLRKKVVSAMDEADARRRFEAHYVTHALHSTYIKAHANTVSHHHVN